MTTAAGRRNTISVLPPFHFEGMTGRVFPLRASLDSLQRFCDAYLNILPEEVGRFRAPIPYVYLMILNYGRMSIDVANVGWLAQREILFNVPIEWYRRVRGRWVFHDWATISPFIFVDDKLSANTGRSVFGWPKAIATLTPTESEWIKDPLAPVTDTTVSTMVFPELYMDAQLEERAFLEIDRDAPISNARIPFDARNPTAPWVIASKIAESAVGFGRDYFAFLEGFGMLPQSWGSDMSNYVGRLGRIAEWAYPFRRDAAANTLNLKQFRSSQEPQCYCFQALTNGPMMFTAFNRAGLLGEQQAFLGDTSGGFTIRLHRWPSLPIFETLGLEAARRWRGAGCEVVQLKPVLPFWFDVNMEYLEGYDLAWRTQDGIWRDRQGREIPDEAKRQYRPNPVCVQSTIPEDCDQDTDRRFNTTLGAFNKAIAGPFRFTGTTVRVLPLLARRAVLEDVLHRYLNEPLGAGQCFTVWAGSGDPDDVVRETPSGPAQPGGPDDHAYIFMTATVYGDVTSATNNVGDWANAEVAFLIPVRRWERDPQGGWKLCGVGLVTAFSFVDSGTAAAAGSEVLGLPMMQANFRNPRSAWMRQVAPGEEGRQKLLRVNAQVLPALGEGQRAEMRNLLDITAGELMDELEIASVPAEAAKWARVLSAELGRKVTTARTAAHEFKNARALALELLGNQVPLTFYTLKQIRDVSDPNRAAYQSLVGIQRMLAEVLDIREIESPLTVYMESPPSLPIVEALGLFGIPVGGQGLGVRYALYPIRPFWLRLAVEEQLGQRLTYRNGCGEWRAGTDGPPSPVGRYFCDRDSTGANRRAVDELDLGDPRPVTSAAVRWRDVDDERVDIREAATAARSIDPQMVIESILSTEWGNHGTRWRDFKRDVMARHEIETSGVDWEEYKDAEKAFFAQVIDEKELPNSDPRVRRARELVDHLASFDEYQAEMEQRWKQIRALWPRVGVDVERRSEDVTKFINHLKSLLSAIGAIAKRDVRGEPSDPNVRDANQERLRSLSEREMVDLAKVLDGIHSHLPDEEVARLTRQFASPVREAVQLARQRVELQRDALFNQISKFAQKPFFVVRRSWAGAEKDRDRVLSSWHAMDGDWYTGPEDGGLGPSDLEDSAREAPGGSEA